MNEPNVFHDCDHCGCGDKNLRHCCIGEPPRDVQYVRQWLPGGEFIHEQPCDVVAMQALISEWFASADRDAA